MSNSSVFGEIIKEYLKKYSTYESKKIARLIVSEIPNTFTNIEHVRNLIRYYRGSYGKYNREQLSEESYQPKITLEEFEDEEYSPYTIHETGFPIMIGADFHIPFQENDAIEMFIERAIDIKAKTILLNGDIIDCYMVSRFLKDPRKRSVKDELDIFVDLLVQINKWLPDIKIIYKYGNHDERFDAYLMNCAPELFKLPEIHLENIIKQKIDDKNINLEIIKNKRVIIAGHLHIIHGHEYVFSISNPVNPARGLYNRAKKSSICNHFHQTSEHTESAIDNKITTCWSIGCMCNLHPLYMPLNKWNHGFAEITNEDGFFNVRNRRIVNYRLF